jgi:replication-associated recombination protein RarA
MSVSSVARAPRTCATLTALETLFRMSDVSVVVMWKERQLVPRLYGPRHFAEDPYSQIVSPHGVPVDDLVSVLQKEIRRGRIDNAVLAAYEMFITSPDVAQHLWRRLRLIAVEDVGMGLAIGPVLIDVLHRNFNATPDGNWMMACHAVRLLASAPKDRTSSEHADWVATKVALGEALVQVPDYAHCVHTRAGQELGRGLTQWWDNGAQVHDELPSADHRYRDELIEIHRRDEADNGTAPRPSRWASASAAPDCD